MTTGPLMSGLGESDDECFLDSGDEGEDDGGPRPEWLHSDCLNVCFALEVGTCCKNPVNPLVGCAVDLADLVDLALRRLGNLDCKGPTAELAYRLKLIPGLLAQVHAILPRLNPTAVAQLLCPVGRLANAIDQVRAYGCPWACGDPDIPDRRHEFAEFGPLLADCSSALHDRLGWPHPERSGSGQPAQRPSTGIGATAVLPARLLPYVP
jgi:hypothetical protein